MKDDRLYLIHILECIERIEQYTIDGREFFLRDTRTQDAVLRNLQTLTESTQRLSDTIKARFSEVEWQSIAGFRNVLVHGYLGMNIRQIWDVVKRDLPTLKMAITKMLST